MEDGEVLGVPWSVLLLPSCLTWLTWMCRLRALTAVMAGHARAAMNRSPMNQQLEKSSSAKYKVWRNFSITCSFRQKQRTRNHSVERLILEHLSIFSSYWHCISVRSLFSSAWFKNTSFAWWTRWCKDTQIAFFYSFLSSLVTADLWQSWRT